jgi:hypothetical protein
MSDEIRTAVDLRASIVDQRGGIERFDGPQRRLLDALVFELAKKPNEIDVRVVTDLMAMLPRPVSAPAGRDDHEAAIAPLLKLFRHLHEEVHTLSAENAQLRPALGGSPYGTAIPASAITPPTADIVPPGEIGSDCHTGMRPGPDDPPRSPPVTIDAKAVKRPNPPATSAARHRGATPSRPPDWDDTPSGRAWRSWVDSGGASYDRWANRNE